MGAPFHSALLKWYRRHRRDLPWRAAPANPYHVLLSEVMLQQTQVATVVPYFLRFLEQLPTLAALAEAPEQHILRLWQGLGYYSRARHLHAAAKTIVADHGGIIPGDVANLLKLPGVGRYTAGAIASIAFGQRAPILDGNVMRVLCRLAAIQSDPRDGATNKQLWKMAEELLPARRVGDFNTALMELGSTLCTPRNPDCPRCPVSHVCQALAMGLQETIPVARQVKPTPLIRRWTFTVNRRNRWLIEQRPAKGRWANLWQFVTVAAEARKPDPTIAATILGVALTDLQPLGRVTHALSHRRYVFTAFSCVAVGRLNLNGVRKWVTLKELAEYPLSTPQLKIAELIRQRQH